MSSTARHARVERARRHWRGALVGAVSLTLLVGGIAAFTRPSSAERSCPSSPTLTVAVTPDLAPVVASVARTMKEACDSVRVSAQDSADVVAAMHQPAERVGPLALDDDLLVAEQDVLLDRLLDDAAGDADGFALDDAGPHVEALLAHRDDFDAGVGAVRGAVGPGARAVDRERQQRSAL